MVIHKENKNVDVLGRILSHQLMFVFFQRKFPANPVHKTNYSLLFLSEVDMFLSTSVVMASLVWSRTFFFRELTCCIKCFQPSFPQRFELHFFFLPPTWPVLSTVCPEPNFPQTVAITCFQHRFWALSFQMSLAAENNCIVTRGGALFRDRKQSRKLISACSALA